MADDLAVHGRGAATSSPGAGAWPSRRDRVRAATSQEIIQVARHLLVTDGPAAVSLRAIARQMGMTAPALYRYFDSHEKLIAHVVADIFTELTGYVGTAANAASAARPLASGAAITRSAAPAAEAAARGLIAASRAFRDWSIAHPHEFAMVFGTPMPGVDLYQPVDASDPAIECGQKFSQVFLAMFADLWRSAPFPAPADDDIDPALLPQLGRFAEQIGSDLPLGVLSVYLRCWVLLYGTVSLETFGHMKFALDDPAPMFELVLADMAAMTGLTLAPQRR